MFTGSINSSTKLVLHIELVQNDKNIIMVDNIGNEEIYVS